MSRFHIVLVLAWVLYFFIHSFLAGFAVKNFMQTRFPAVFKYYRLIYNLIASTGLLIILIINGALASPLLINSTIFTTVLGLMLATSGLLVIKKAFKCYNLKEYLGIEKAAKSADPRLITDGILAVVRHPIYTGTLLIVFGFWFYRPNATNLVTVICICLYLIAGIYLEEKKLRATFGKAYDTYKKKVPMLIPRLKLMK